MQVGCSGAKSAQYSSSPTIAGATVDKPQGLAVMQNDGFAKLNWDEVPAVDSYNLYVALAPGVTKSAPYKVDFFSRGGLLTGLPVLSPGIKFYAAISAMRNGVESELSSEKSFVSQRGSGDLVDRNYTRIVI